MKDILKHCSIFAVAVSFVGCPDLEAQMLQGETRVKYSPVVHHPVTPKGSPQVVSPEGLGTPTATTGTELPGAPVRHPVYTPAPTGTEFLGVPVHYPELGTPAPNPTIESLFALIRAGTRAQVLLIGDTRVKYILDGSRPGLEISNGGKLERIFLIDVLKPKNGGIISRVFELFYPALKFPDAFTETYEAVERKETTGKKTNKSSILTSRDLGLMDKMKYMRYLIEDGSEELTKKIAKMGLEDEEVKRKREQLLMCSLLIAGIITDTM